jgi:hypothetical protein
MMMEINGGGSRWQRHLAAVVAAVGFLLWVPFGVAQDDKKKEELPKGVAAMTKEHLQSKVPNFFSFGDDDGKRYWLRVDSKHFIERYPDGTEARFKILGTATVNDKKGTIAAKIAGDMEKTGTANDGTFQVFISDKGQKEMRFLFRNGEDGEWGDIAEMAHAE